MRSIFIVILILTANCCFGAVPTPMDNLITEISKTDNALNSISSQIRPATLFFFKKSATCLKDRENCDYSAYQASMDSLDAFHQLQLKIKLTKLQLELLRRDAIYLNSLPKGLLRIYTIERFDADKYSIDTVASFSSSESAETKDVLDISYRTLAETYGKTLKSFNERLKKIETPSKE